MFSLVIALLNFSEIFSLKYLFLNNESRMVRPNIIDIDPSELKNCAFMIILNKSTANYNISSSKIHAWKEIKNINVQAFNMITNKDKAKATAEPILCNWKCKFNSTICNWKQKWNNEACPCWCKNYQNCDKYYSI